jgi:PRC-barrel domain
MLRRAILATALIGGVSSIAVAAGQATQTPAASNGNMREQMTSTLQKSGFSDVKVMPDAFLVSAKDKNGNPVTMFINPNSVTELVGTSTPAQSDTTGAGAFATVPTTEDLSSKVVGLDVYNKANQDIGKIKDIAFDANGVRAYIVAVGGFLGLGDHYVAVHPSALQLTYNEADKKWHAAMDANADQLKKAPEYKYPAT